MRQLCYAILVVLLLSSCRDKLICPTFQSTYILDDSVRGTYFSYLWYLEEDERKAHLAANAKIPPPDSLGVTLASAEAGGGVDYWEYTAKYKVPPRNDVKFTKYGIPKRTPVIPNIVRNFQLKTSPMENVLTPPDVKKAEEPSTAPTDSTAIAPLDSTAAVAQVDSLSTGSADSLAVAKEETPKQKWERFKYGFNPLDSMQPDQEYYFRKYGWLLQNPKPAEEKLDSTALEAALADSLQNDSTKRKGLKGLFGGGKKKPKKEKKKKSKDETPVEPQNNDEGTVPEEGEGGEVPDGGN